MENEKTLIMLFCLFVFLINVVLNSLFCWFFIINVSYYLISKPRYFGIYNYLLWYPTHVWLIIEHACVAGVLAMIGMFLSYYVVDKFYANLTGSFLFPWCVLLITIATICILTGAFFYCYILCNWYLYSDYYGRWGYYSDNIETLATRSTGSFRRSSYRSPKSEMMRDDTSIAYINPVLGVSRQSTTYALPLTRSTFSGSIPELRTSRQSLTDSPRILRSISASDFHKEESDYLARLRSSNSDLDLANLRNSRSRTEYVPRSSYSVSSHAASEPIVHIPREAEDSLLDQLYASAKRSVYWRGYILKLQY